MICSRTQATHGETLSPPTFLSPSSMPLNGTGGKAGTSQRGGESGAERGTGQTLLHW